jgi:polyhydroxybutyrate depolymerase
MLLSVSWLLAVTMYAQNGTLITDSIFRDKYRTFLLYIPAIYDPAQPVPLLLNLHGTTESAAYQNILGNFRPIADTANFIIVLPNGQPVPQMGGARGWNIFPTSSGTNDFGFLSDLIDTISARYNIDKNRIYSTGHSAGAIMSYRLACSMSQRFAAIAPVNGFMFPEHVSSCNATHPMPVIEIHGSMDPVRNWNGEGPVTKAVNVDTMLAHWVLHNGCSFTPVYDSVPDIDKTDHCWAQHFTWSGGSKGSSVELYKVIKGGHTWPGSAHKEPYGSTNMDFDACEKIWQFLSKYRLNTLTSYEKPPSLSLKIKVFPNPVTHVLTIQCTGVEKSSDVVIHDIIGNVLFRAEGIADLSTLTINTSGWTKGLFVIIISDGKEVFSCKVIK